MRLSVAEEHPEFLQSVSLVLQAAVDLDLVSKAQILDKRHVVQTSFDSVSVPGQSIGAYVRRLGRRFRCGREVFAIALVYSGRAVAAGIPLRAESVHRLFLTSLALAAKFHEDGSPGNNLYAKWGGIPAEELCGLEIKLLQALKYRLFVDAEEFEACESPLLDHACCPKVLATIVQGVGLEPQTRTPLKEESALGPATAPVSACTRKGHVDASWRRQEVARRRMRAHRRPVVRCRTASFGEN